MYIWTKKINIWLHGCTYMWSVCRSTILLRIIAEIRYTRGCRRNKWRRLLESSSSWKSSESGGYISAQVDISASSKSKNKEKTNVPKCPRTGSGTISSCRWRDHMLVRYYDCDNLGRSVLQLSHEFHEFVHTKEWFPAEVECLERWSQIHDSDKIRCESLKVPSLRPVIFVSS